MLSHQESFMEKSNVIGWVIGNVNIVHKLQTQFCRKQNMFAKSSMEDSAQMQFSCSRSTFMFLCFGTLLIIEMYEDVKERSF